MSMLNSFWVAQLIIICFIFQSISPETRVYYIVFFTISNFFIHILFLQYLYRVYLVTFNMIVLPVIIIPAYLILGFMTAGYMQDYLWQLAKVLFLTVIIIISWTSFLLFRIRTDLKILLNGIFFILPCMIFFFKIINTPHSVVNNGIIFCSVILPCILGTGFMILHTGIEEKINRQECCERTIHAVTGLDSLITNQHSEIIDKAIGYIHGNYMEPITREDIADFVEISTDYLGKLFLKYTGKTIKEYINNYRTYKAAQMIEETNIRFLEIAHDVGFDCLATFNRYFQKIYGMPPRCYRKMTGTTV